MASHLPFEERQVLYRLNKAKTPKARIAEILERDRSTIYRELKRNTGGRGYRAKQAQCLTDERRLACRGEPKMSDPELKKDVKRLLKQKWSPDQITGWLRKHFPRQGNRRVSHQTIYNWLESEAPDLRVYLRRGHRRQEPETRGKLKDCVGIEGRLQTSLRRLGRRHGRQPRSTQRHRDDGRAEVAVPAGPQDGKPQVGRYDAGRLPRLEGPSGEAAANDDTRQR